MSRLDDLETYSKADNLLIYGLSQLSHAEKASNTHGSYESSDATCDSVIALCNEHLGIKITKARHFHGA
jgi:hypothetical protein